MVSNMNQARRRKRASQRCFQATLLESQRGVGAKLTLAASRKGSIDNLQLEMGVFLNLPVGQKGQPLQAEHKGGLSEAPSKKPGLLARCTSGNNLNTILDRNVLSSDLGLQQSQGMMEECPSVSFSDREAPQTPHFRPNTRDQQDSVFPRTKEQKVVDAESMKRSVHQMMMHCKSELACKPACDTVNNQQADASHMQSGAQQSCSGVFEQTLSSNASRGRKQKNSAKGGFQADEKEEAEVVAKEFAERNSGKYIPVKVRFYDTFTFKCCLDHKFDLTAEQITKGKWCDICEETWSFLVKFARKKDGAVLDSQLSSNVRLKCVRGHEFSVKPSL